MMLDFVEPTIEGFKTRIYSCGNQSSTAVVFVHGNPGPSDDWHQSMKAVGEFSYAIAPDMPGFGFSDRSFQFNVSVDGYAKHLNAVINFVKLERVHLVLHDFGGGWGLEWAARNPDKVASICVVNCGIFRNYSWHWIAKIWRTPMLGELFQMTTTRYALQTILNAQNPRAFPKEFIDRIWSHSDWAHRKTVLTLYRLTNPSDMEQQASLIIASLKGHNIPGLVIWGKDDPYLETHFSKLQQEYMDCDIKLMDGCGHWPMIDKPNEFKDILIPFLKNLRNR